MLHLHNIPVYKRYVERVSKLRTKTRSIPKRMRRTTAVLQRWYAGMIFYGSSISTVRSQMMTSSPSQSPSPSSTLFCEDVFLWTDALQRGCKWYEGGGGGDGDNDASFNRCEEWGGRNPNETSGLTAKDACCVCGGSSDNAEVNERLPSIVPSASALPTMLCVDVPNWSDAFGDTCLYYNVNGEEACLEFGECCEANGYTANSACCVCGGGLFYKDPNDPSIILYPSAVPTVSVLNDDQNHNDTSSARPSSDQNRPTPFPTATSNPSKNNINDANPSSSSSPLLTYCWIAVLQLMMFLLLP